MIKDNILKVKERISLVCAKVNRDPADIAIVAVSKGRDAAEIEEAIAAGITDIGENRTREALDKYKELQASATKIGGLAKQVGKPNSGLPAIKWHMVGHLQTNKVKDAVKVFDLIHSVDSVELAREINKQAAKINKVQAILIEVKTSPEESKFGFGPQGLEVVLTEITSLKNINIKGLMTIAPLADNPEKARPYFRRLRELRDGINAISDKRCAIRDLSMGMTDDFEVAIEEGATMIRIGRAIFEVS